MRNRLLIGLLSVLVCGANAVLAQGARSTQRHASCTSKECTQDSECIPPNGECTGCFADRSGDKKCGVIAEQLPNQ